MLAVPQQVFSIGWGLCGQLNQKVITIHDWYRDLLTATITINDNDGFCSSMIPRLPNSRWGFTITTCCLIGIPIPTLSRDNSKSVQEYLAMKGYVSRPKIGWQSIVQKLEKGLPSINDPHHHHHLSRTSIGTISMEKMYSSIKLWHMPTTPQRFRTPAGKWPMKSPGWIWVRVQVQITRHWCTLTTLPLFPRTLFENTTNAKYVTDGYERRSKGSWGRRFYIIFVTWAWPHIYV